MPIAVLFVCMGNHCRSPAAHAVAQHVAAAEGLSNIVFDSAGTTGHHRGDHPHPLATAEGARRGYRVNHIGRLIHPDDFARFDMILVMDWLTMRALQNIAPEQYRHKIELVMRYAQNSDDAEIPDPFYLEQEAFNQAVDYMEDAALGLLDLVKRRLPQPVAA